MTDTAKPEALRLAEVLEQYRDCTEYDSEQAAAELRRLYAENERIRTIVDTDKASADHWRAECEKMRQGGEAVVYLCEAGNRKELILASEFVADQYVFAGWRITPLYTYPPLQADAYCQACGDKATRELPEESGVFPGPYCDHCGPGAKSVQADADFKNFHRALCERFDYAHDPVDWKRDQVSLIEWIAKKIAQSQADACKVLLQQNTLPNPATQKVFHAYCFAPQHPADACKVPEKGIDLFSLQEEARQIVRGKQCYPSHIKDRMTGLNEYLENEITLWMAEMARSYESPGNFSCKSQKKLWLWKNFVEGRPEYFAFDNPFPVHLDCGDPQTLGNPCGYALFKTSRCGRTDVSEEDILRSIAVAASKRAEPTQVETQGWQPIETAPKDFVTEFDGWNGERVPNVIWTQPEYGKKGEYTWCQAEYVQHHGWVMEPVRGLTHWMPLPPAPSTPPMEPGQKK